MTNDEGNPNDRMTKARAALLRFLTPSNIFRHFFVIRHSSLVIFFLAGCSNGPAPNTSRFIVTARTTPFFLFGPSQARGADYILKKDATIMLVSREFGYSRIKTSDGQIGYVANDDIAPNPNPEPTPTPKPTGRTGRSQSGNGSNFPQPDAPLPGDPGRPIPSFRY